MEKPSPKMDRKKSKLSKKLSLAFRDKMDALGVDAGFMRFLLTDSVVLPFNFADLALPSDPLERKRLRYRLWKRMKRREKKLYGDDWKMHWKDTVRQLKDLKKTKYVQTLFGIEPKIRSYKRNKPRHDRILGLIWMLKTYFERLTKFKTGKARPCWNLIAELVSFISLTKYSAPNIASWWRKAKKDFEILDEDTHLDLLLKFYQKNKIELDKQCREWFGKCVEWREKIKIQKADTSFQEEIEKLTEFSEE